MKTIKKISIAYIIDQISTADGFSGGTEKQLIETISNLDSNKFIPILICLRQPLKSSLWNDIKIQKINLDINSIFSLSSFIKLFKISLFLRKLKIDILQTFFFDSTFFGVLLAKLSSSKVVITSRRDMGYWYTAKLLFVLKLLNIFTDRILVNSVSIKNMVIKTEGVPDDRIDVIYNGINSSLFSNTLSNNIISRKLKLDRDVFIVGIVANLNRHVKRVDLFILSAVEILKSRNDVDFVIIGDGHLKKELIDMAEYYKVSKNIHFLGYQEKINQLINSFDIGVLSSNSEGFSNTLLEYAAAGIPTVAVESGGTSELFSKIDLGVLVPSDNPKSMADAINSLLDNPEKMKEISSKSKIIIKSCFNWNQKILEMEDYYEKLL